MKVIVQVLGPTGVGKSRAALAIAGELRGEIISADSMQVYCGFDIGTDKIAVAERRGVPHHLIDIISDCGQFNAARFLELSHATTMEIHGRGRLPVVCGGTAFYLKTMINGLFPEENRDRGGREALQREWEERGPQAMWQEVQRIDPLYAAKIGANDRVRILRALEIHRGSGVAPSELFALTRSPFEGCTFLRVGLNMERERLYEAINRRVDRMVAQGLLEETRRLLRSRPAHCPPFQAVGYREMVQYLNGELTFAAAVELIKQHSRNFAKRQLTWFRRETDIRWFTPDDTGAMIAWIKQHQSNT